MGYEDTCTFFSMIGTLKNSLTHNEKKNTDDNVKLPILSYRPFIVVFIFTFNKISQLPTF